MGRTKGNGRGRSVAARSRCKCSGRPSRPAAAVRLRPSVRPRPFAHSVARSFGIASPSRSLSSGRSRSYGLTANAGLEIRTWNQVRWYLVGIGELAGGARPAGPVFPVFSKTIIRGRTFAPLSEKIMVASHLQKILLECVNTRPVLGYKRENGGKTLGPFLTALVFKS